MKENKIYELIGRAVVYGTLYVSAIAGTVWAFLECTTVYQKKGGIKMFLGIETKKDLKEQLEEAETRAVTHFSKVNRIENNLKNSEETKENYFITLDKIKKVIFSNGNQKKDN